MDSLTCHCTNMS